MCVCSACLQRWVHIVVTVVVVVALQVVAATDFTMELVSSRLRYPNADTNKWEKGRGAQGPPLTAPACAPRRIACIKNTRWPNGHLHRATSRQQSCCACATTHFCPNPTLTGANGEMQMTKRVTT